MLSIIAAQNAAAQLLQWNTFDNLGTETTEPSVFNDSNIAASNLTLGSGVTAAANANRFGGSNWFNTGNSNPSTVSEAITGNDYIQFVVTPINGYAFTPTTLVFNWEASGTGPQNVALRSSADGFSNNLGAVVPTAAIGTANAIIIPGLNCITTSTTFRLYGYGATAAGGTGGFDVSANVVNVQLNGTVFSVSPVVSSGTAAGTVSLPFSFSVNATNAPSSYTLSGVLPAGLNFDNSTGIITGTPTVVGTFSVGVTATNCFGTSSGAGITIVIAPITFKPFDNFARPNSNTLGSPSSGGVDEWAEVEAVSNQTIINSGRLDMIAHTSSGIAYDYFDMVGRYTTIFSNANTSLTWFCNMRISLSNPGGLGSGSYGMAYILGCNTTNFTSGSGYAVVFGESGTMDNVRLIYFTGGVNGTQTEVVRNTLLPGNQMLNIRVDYSPCLNNWTLSVNSSGPISGPGFNFTDPSLVNYNSIGTAVNSSGIALNLRYSGSYFSHSSTVTEYAAFDNIYIPNDLSGVNTYTWNGSVSTNYSVPNNWTPSRDCPKITDVLQFTSSSPAISNVTNLPTTLATAGKILVSDNRTVTLFDPADDATLTFGLIATTGPALFVEAGSILVFDVQAGATNMDGFDLLLGSGSTGIINGSLFLKNTTGTTSPRHLLEATDASSIIIGNGGLVKAEKLSGNVFGNNGPVANILIFAAGSAYESYEGGNPFGYPAPASKVVFQTGSTYRHFQNSPPSLFGRTYGNFEFRQTGGVSLNLGSNLVAVIDTLRVFSGTANITGSTNSLPVNITVKGDLLISSGATFNYSSVKPSTLSFNGTSGLQKLNNLGTLVLGDSLTFEVNNTSATTAQLEVQSNITIPNTLKVTAGDLRLAADVTLKSTATHTANVSAVTGTISYSTGRFIIERYLFAKSSWRLLATPILKVADDATSPTINESWREGISDTTIGTGYGTRITGPGPTGSAGVDEYTQRNSMKSYAMTNNTYTEVSGNDLAMGARIANDEGYYIFIRGDRGVAVGEPTGSTTLRMKGKLRIGSQNFPITTPGAYRSIGNPYASRIDFRTVTKTPTMESTLIIWNPNALGQYAVGRFQQYVFTGSDYTSITYGIRNFVESGEAVFVAAAVDSIGSVTIKESDKTMGSSLVSRIEANAPSLEIALLAHNADSTEYAADGTRIDFHNNYSMDINSDDARKFLNSTNNLSVLHNTKKLFADRRQMPAAGDTIFLSLTAVANGNYKFEFNPTLLSDLPLQAFLNDNFLQTQTPVSLVQINTASFSITNDAGSKTENRFYIFFKPLTVVPLNFVAVTAKRESADKVRVNWSIANAGNISRYIVERSNDGSRFSAIGNIDAGNAAAYGFTDIAAKGELLYYRIAARETSGNSILSNVVKVAAGSSAPMISINPNPVRNRTIVMQVSGLRGEYSFQLLNSAGATIQNGKIFVNFNTEISRITLTNKLAPGIYRLIVFNNREKIVETLSVL